MRTLTYSLPYTVDTWQEDSIEHTNYHDAMKSRYCELPFKLKHFVYKIIFILDMFHHIIGWIIFTIILQYTYIYILTFMTLLVKLSLLAAADQET